MAEVLHLVRPAAKARAKDETKPVKLTKRVVEAIAPDPNGAVVQRRDSELKGFGVRVTPAGVRTYFVQYRDLAGHTRRIAIGRHGVLTAEEARKVAVQRLADVTRGDNPSVARKAARAKAKETQTVKQLVERFLREYVDPKRKTRTAEQYRRLLETRVNPVLGSMAADAVTREAVMSLHLSMKSTPYEANRVLAVLSKMFNVAEVWRVRPDGSNPVRHVERYKERKRDRFLSHEELKKLGTVLDEAERTQTALPGVIVALRLLALTGCRLSEILGLRWTDVDLDVGVLRLPDAKAGARLVPLGSPAVDLLNSLMRVGTYVVPGTSPEEPLSKNTLEHGWFRLRKLAQLNEVRIHDLRHTIGTYAGQAGLNAFMVRDILGHKTLAMTDRYVSQDTSPLRSAADQVAGRIAAAMRSDNQENVVE